MALEAKRRDVEEAIAELREACVRMEAFLAKTPAPLAPLKAPASIGGNEMVKAPLARTP